MNSPINAEVVNALLEPVLDVIRSCTGVEAHVAGLGFAAQMPPTPCLMVSVVLTGSVTGPISWSFDPNVARELAGRMLSSDTLPELDSPDCTDALAELANIVVGNATGALQEAGYAVEVVPPTTRVLRSSPRQQLAEKALAVTLETPLGAVVVIMELSIVA